MANTLGILDNAPLFVHAIEFGDDELTFVFQEKREVQDSVMIAKTMKILVDDELKEEMFLRLQEAACLAIDMGFVTLRNPEPPEG